VRIQSLFLGPRTRAFRAVSSFLHMKLRGPRAAAGKLVLCRHLVGRGTMIRGGRRAGPRRLHQQASSRRGGSGRISTTSGGGKSRASTAVMEFRKRRGCSREVRGGPPTRGRFKFVLPSGGARSSGIRRGPLATPTGQSRRRSPTCLSEGDDGPAVEAWCRPPATGRRGRGSVLEVLGLPGRSGRTGRLKTYNSLRSSR